MSILYSSDSERGQQWKQRFAVEEPSIPFHIWPDVGDPGAVEYLVAWIPPEAFFENLPSLRVVFSVGAGVDQFDLGHFPPSVKLVRMLDPGITQGMAEYVTLGVLALHRNLPEYLVAQRAARWEPIPCSTAQSCRVGIMGLGNLGRAAIAQLQNLGFQLSGWSRSRHVIPGVRCFAGREELADFLGQVDILVCLLPLTDATRGILCRETFNLMPPGTHLINAGRGGHLCEESLLQALDSGRISVALLDVLQQEPPAPDHPFWHHPNILMTPHIAASTQTDSACQVLLDNIRRHRAGLTMSGEVDRNSGY